MPEPSLRLPYGLREGLLTHVSKVASGLACGCVCPACNEPLVAKKGESRQHHFAHSAGSDCATAVETALHLAAKNILDTSPELVLPAVAARFDGTKGDVLLAPEQAYKVDRVELERRAGNTVPDVQVWIRGRRVAIEVRVTHEVDAAKAARFRTMGLSAIEIDLSLVPRDLALHDIRPLVLGGGKHKKWVYNAVAERKRREILASGRLLRTVNRGLALHVDGCPISARVYRGQSYANVIDNCIGCEHAIEIGDNMRNVVCGGFPPDPRRTGATNG